MEETSIGLRKIQKKASERSLKLDKSRNSTKGSKNERHKKNKSKTSVPKKRSPT